MTLEDAQELANDMRENWKQWGDLERGDAVVLLRDFGLSFRKIARIALCSEGTIRNAEIVGRLPYHWKQYLLDGHALRTVLTWWRNREQ